MQAIEPKVAGHGSVLADLRVGSRSPVGIIVRVASHVDVSEGVGTVKNGLNADGSTNDLQRKLSLDSR